MGSSVFDDIRDFCDRLSLDTNTEVIAALYDQMLLDRLLELKPSELALVASSRLALLAPASRAYMLRNPESMDSLIENLSRLNCLDILDHSDIRYIANRGSVKARLAVIGSSISLSEVDVEDMVSGYNEATIIALASRGCLKGNALRMVLLSGNRDLVNKTISYSHLSEELVESVARYGDADTIAILDEKIGKDPMVLKRPQRTGVMEEENIRVKEDKAGA